MEKISKLGKNQLKELSESLRKRRRIRSAQLIKGRDP